MTRDEFLAKAQEVLGYKTSKIEVTWTMGGITGGNCWGDVANRPIEPDPEPELEQLDAVLEAICPSISFMQYRGLVSAVVVRGTKSYPEYYGNESIYGVKSVDLGDLYDALVKIELMS